jgi:hypothetical protein
MDRATLARDVTKWIVISIVDLKTTDVTANTISNDTRFDKDDLIVKLGSGAVGMVVAAHVKPVTDKMVDKSADFVIEQWRKRRPKKTTEKKEK